MNLNESKLRTLTPALSHGERKKRCEATRRTSPAISSRTLATVRDTLLPKLLSGEVRVAKAVISPATE